MSDPTDRERRSPSVAASRPRRARRARAAALAATLGIAAAIGFSPAARAAPAPAAWLPDPAPPDAWRPVDALRLPTGGIVIADGARNRLFLVAPGKPPLRCADPPDGAVEWTGLAHAPGLSFFALDGPGRRVHQFDFAGNYLGVAVDLAARAEEHGLGAVEPGGLAVDRSGRAAVTDRLGDRLLVFSPGWVYTGTWGATGDAPGSWRRPGRVAAGTGSEFIVSDEGNKRIVLLDGLGRVLAARAFDRRVDAVAVLGPGRFAAALADTLLVLDRTLATAARLPLPAGPGCRDEAWFSGALAADGDAILAGEGCSGRVARLVPGGP